MEMLHHAPDATPADKFHSELPGLGKRYHKKQAASIRGSATTEDVSRHVVVKGEIHTISDTPKHVPVTEHASTAEHAVRGLDSGFGNGATSPGGAPTARIPRGLDEPFQPQSPRAGLALTRVRSGMGSDAGSVGDALELGSARGASPQAQQQQQQRWQEQPLQLGSTSAPPPLPPPSVTLGVGLGRPLGSSPGDFSVAEGSPGPIYRTASPVQEQTAHASPSKQDESGRFGDYGDIGMRALCLAAADEETIHVGGDAASMLEQVAVSEKQKAKGVKKLKPRNPMKKKKRAKKAQRSPSGSSKAQLGIEINSQHRQYALSYCMMMGIRHSVGNNMSGGATLQLSMDEFMKVNKTIFPPTGCSTPGSLTPPHKLAHPFKFKDYCPMVYRKVRERFGIDEADYQLSLCGHFNFIEFVSNSKSGQFFFYSADGRYMIKTQSKAESKFLRRIMPHYYRYILTNPNTLITRFFGMYRVKMHHLKSEMHFVIMGSVFFTDKDIHRRFDLKGSTVGRGATEAEIEKNGVLKDNDLEDLRGRGTGQKMNLGPDRKHALLGQLRKDAQFLAHLRIMDYSLLLGVHRRGADEKGNIMKGVHGGRDLEGGGSTAAPAAPPGAGGGAGATATAATVATGAQHTHTAREGGEAAAQPMAEPTTKLRRNSAQSDRNSGRSGSDDSEEEGFDSEEEEFEEPAVPIFDPKADIFHRDEGGMLSADGKEIYFTGQCLLPAPCCVLDRDARTRTHYFSRAFGIKPT